MADLVCDDSSREQADPLQDSSISRNDMNTIDLGSAIGATLYKMSDRGSAGSSKDRRFWSQLQMCKKCKCCVRLEAGASPEKEALF